MRRPRPSCWRLEKGSHTSFATAACAWSPCAPGFTKTGLYADSGVPGMAGRLLPFAMPEEVVRVALAAYDAGRVVRVVGLANRLLALSGALTPRFILRWLMAKMFAPTIAVAGSERQV